MFVTKSPGSRVLMLVINNHYRARPRTRQSSGDLLWFLVTSDICQDRQPGAWDFGEGKSHRILHKLSPGVSLSQSEDSMENNWPMRGQEWSSQPVTGCLIVPVSSSQTIARVVARLVTTLHSSQARSHLSHLSHSSIHLSELKPLENISDLPDHSWQNCVFRSGHIYEWAYMESDLWPHLTGSGWPITRPISPNQTNQPNQRSRHQETSPRVCYWPMRVKGEWELDRGCDNCYAHFCSPDTDWWGPEMAIWETNL